MCLGDTARKFGPMTPRHTIDAILGLKNRERLLESKFLFLYKHKYTHNYAYILL